MKKKILWLKIGFIGIAFVSMLAVFSVYRLGDRMMLWSFVLFFMIYLVTVSSGNHLIFIKNKDIALFSGGWFVVYLMSIVFNSSIPDGTSWIYLFYVTMFLMLRRNIQWEICVTFTKVLSVLLILGIVEFIIYQFTGIGIVLGYVERPENQGYERFAHLIFSMVSERYDIVRFQSLANEPGLLGTLCGLLLFPTSNNKDLKIPFYTFLVAGVLTYSLAFYVLAVIFFLSRSVGKLHNLKYIISIILVAAIVIYAVRDNVQELIIDRLESGDADNRSSLSMTFYFDKALAEGKLWLGIGAHNLPYEISGSNAGARVWIIQFGLVGLAIIMLTYIVTYYIRLGSKLQKNDIIFLIAFWLSCYQRQTIIDSYTILTFMMMPLVASGYHMRQLKPKNNEKSPNINYYPCI